MTTYKLNLSTTEPNNDVGLIKIRQDDTMTQRLSVTVYEHDKLIDLTGYDIYLNSKMPNQSTVRDKVKDLINPKNGHFSYTLIDSFWQCLGDISLWFSFEINGTRDSTANFEYRVIQGHCKEINQGNYIWEFEELKRKLEEMGLDLSNNYNDFKERLDVLLEMFKTMNTYSKEEIDRMLIKLIAGEKISATFTMDFKNKVAGSLVENPSIAKYANGSSLLYPTDSTWKEFVTTGYQNIYNNDNVLLVGTDSTAGNMVQRLLSFSVLEDFKRKFPSLTITIDQFKKNVEKFGVTTYMKGSSSAGNKASQRVYVESSSVYGGAISNTTAGIKGIRSEFGTNNFINSLSDDGVVSVLLNSEPSDGKTPSSLSIDYASLDYTVELSLRDIFATKEELEAVKLALEATKNELKSYVDTELAKKQDKLKKTGKVNITLAGAVPSASYPFFYSIDGNQFELGGRGKFPRTVGHVFYQLPVGVRPISQIIRVVDFIDSDYTKRAIFEINTDGTCKIYYNGSDGVEISISSLRFTIA